MKEKERVNLKRITATGDVMMGTGVIFVVSIAAALHNFDAEISISVKVLGHIAVIVFATLMKIGYLLRCIGQYEQGQDNY